MWGFERRTMMRNEEKIEEKETLDCVRTQRVCGSMLSPKGSCKAEKTGACVLYSDMGLLHM